MVLEGLSGKQRDQRIQVLHSNSNTGAVMLTTLGIHVEMILQMTFFSLPFLLSPIEIEGWDLDYILALENTWALNIQLICYILAVAFVAPFYVCCGFILYLNQRTALEAWDIELGFKKIVKRLAPSSAALVILGALVMGGQPIPAAAQEPDVSPRNLADLVDGIAQESQKQDEEAKFPPSQNPEAVEIRQQLDSLLNSDRFGEHYQETQSQLSPQAIEEFIKWLLNLFSEPDLDEETDKPLDFGFLTGFATLVKIIFIALLAALLVYVLYRYQPWLWFTDINRSKGRSTVKTVLGMSVDKNQLPENVFTLIGEKIEGRQWRDAMSLMFRTHIVLAIEHHGVPFKASSTESECVKLLQGYTSRDEIECFKFLILQWQSLAYAHKQPQASDLQTLYRRWCDVMQGYLKQ